MKYIDTDKLKAEIEQRNLANYCGTAEQYEEELFALLDTLEEPVSEELNEEIKRMMVKQPFFIRGKDQIAFARHFAVWGAKHYRDSTKMVSDDLEEAANNYISPIENEQGLSFIGFSGQDIKDAFKAGSEWQKQKRCVERCVE